MKVLLFFTLMIFHSISYADSIWVLAKDQKIENKIYKNVRIEGVITHKDKRIYARDSIFDAKIKDLNSDLYFDLEIQTIKWLKRINYFECEKDQIIELKGDLLVNRKGDHLGKMTLKSKAKLLKCKTNNIEDKK